jgi:hypothetical protein
MSATWTKHVSGVGHSARNDVPGSQKPNANRAISAFGPKVSVLICVQPETVPKFAPVMTSVCGLMAPALARVNALTDVG